MYVGVFGNFEMAGPTGQEMIVLDIKKHTYIDSPDQNPFSVVTVSMICYVLNNNKNIR